MRWHAVALLCLLAVCAEAKISKSKTPSSTSDYCYNEDTGMQVRTADCPHNCCVNDKCGSSDQCKTALIVGLVIIGSVLLCCCCCVIVVFMFWRKKGCFSKGSKPYDSASHGTPAPQQGYPHNPQDNLYPMTGYPPPPQQGGYYPPPPQQQYGYPPPLSPQSGYPPQHGNPPAYVPGYPPYEQSQFGPPPPPPSQQTY
eukprot:TRINITY_DN46611_c0_g1_i1.p1 TRINITY_DN46611_c0_g1~~TRINITY_DN46611_c0_g1_i1.p1  ORF type:complete len:213 (+),score=18.70 TRINITY_DN46611_c0_g1_i1:47-640(+)